MSERAAVGRIKVKVTIEPGGRGRYRWFARAVEAAEGFHAGELIAMANPAGYASRGRAQAVLELVMESAGHWDVVEIDDRKAVEHERRRRRFRRRLRVVVLLAGSVAVLAGVWVWLVATR